MIIMKKKVLVITHAASEGAGTLEEFLKYCGASIKSVKLYKDERLPAVAQRYDAIISLGGPMDVHEDDKYPFLRKEAKFLEQAIESNIPILGICLGAQMIARVCGARVVKAAEQELGWKDVFVTDAGKRDILFQGLPNMMKVFQWHEDTFEIPHGGLLLATANGCPNQGFRYGNAYGLQFHVEITSDILMEWFNGKPELHEYIDVYRGIERDFFAQAKMIYSNFMWLVDLCCQSSRTKVNK